MSQALKLYFEVPLIFYLFVFHFNFLINVLLASILKILICSFCFFLLYLSSKSKQFWSWVVSPPPPPPDSATKLLQNLEWHRSTKMNFCLYLQQFFYLVLTCSSRLSFQSMLPHPNYVRGSCHIDTEQEPTNYIKTLYN